MAERRGWAALPLALWLLTALIAWTAIFAAHRLGALVWTWSNPGHDATRDPNSAPPWLTHGLVATGLAIAVVVGICLWLRLGLWWLLVALALAAVLYWLIIPILPGALGAITLLVVPPLVGALWFPPKAQVSR